MDRADYLAEILKIGAFYGLYLLVPLLCLWLWKRGARALVLPLLLVWGAGLVYPVIDYLRVHQQVRAAWNLAILPDAIPIDGKVFVADDPIRTPLRAINGYNAPTGTYGLYHRAEVMEALVAGPVDFADLRFFQRLAQKDAQDRTTIELPAGTRLEAQYLMLSHLDAALIDALKHPEVDQFPPGFGVNYVILDVPDPTAFDLRNARIVMLLPYATQRYRTWPYNPFVTNSASAASYETWRDLQLDLFCAKVTGQARDRCRRAL